jgi:hypothetical protein
MNPRLLLSIVIVALLGAASALSAAPKRVRSTSNVQSDLATIEQRQSVVELANHLSQPADLPAIPDDLKTPFTPVGFDRPDPVEKRGLPSAAPSANAGPNAAPKQVTPRDILETIASKVNSTSSITMGGVTSLFVKLPGGGQKRLKVGDKLTITFEGSDYELEIAAIDSTTFTLSLNNEKITRPIKSGKTK